MRPRVCACGCGQPVTNPRARFLVRHNIRVAKPDRRLAGHKGRATFAYRCRARLFAREVESLRGRSLTREELLAVFQRIYYRAYNAGYQCGKGRYQPTVRVADQTRCADAARGGLA